MFGACTTLPEPTIEKYSAPENVYVGKSQPERPIERLDKVHVKINFPSMNHQWDDKALCENFFKKAEQELVKKSKKLGGDGVIEIHSVVFLMNGKRETHSTPECSDDGEEGQILAEGVAFKYKSDPH